ncbi:chitin deacetylase, partial [Kappamyces sp. JEL0829]
CSSQDPTNPVPTSYPPVSGGAGQLIVSCATPGDFVLSFDDGIGLYDSQLLDTLASEGVVATFFVNGYNWGDLTIDPWRSMLLRIQSAGHQIASHTMDHLDLTTLTTLQVYEQVRRADVAIAKVLGAAPLFVRPPYGNVNANILQALKSWGYTAVWENILNHDTDHASDSPEDQLAEDMSSYMSTLDASDPSVNSFISLNHDTVEVTATQFVSQIIPIIRNRGYRFVTLAQCIYPNNPNNWYRPLP